MLTFGHHRFADDQPLVMAIINRTPDSFYDRGATYAHDAALGARAAGRRAGRADHRHRRG